MLLGFNASDASVSFLFIQTKFSFDVRTVLSHFSLDIPIIRLGK